MSTSYFFGKTLDDVMRSAVTEIRLRGDRISPSKGPATELRGILLEITNPLARLSRTETRGKLFSALGELCWYLAGTNALEFIEYYIPTYDESADGSIIFGGYGPRLFEWEGVNQIENVSAILKKKPHSRQAVIQLFDRHDIVEERNDVPCTCTLQFMNRNDKLDLFVSMRSNDVYWGLPHDVFCFTMLQEIMARSLGLELGTYKHAVGSFHLYDRHLGAAKRFLTEGFQPTRAVMPAMPAADPWPAIALVLEAESTIRTSGSVDEGKLQAIDGYWLDLIRLLQIFRASVKDRDVRKLTMLDGMMSSRVYSPYIARAVRKLSVVQSSE